MSRHGEILDGVVRYPPTGINVVIVGAGLGGLQAALECWRKGHEVQVLEKSKTISEAGDIINLSPNSYCAIRQYPRMLEEWDRFAHDTETCFFYPDGKIAIPKSEQEYNLPGVATHAIWPIRSKPIVSRRDLAVMFSEQCRRLGIQVRLGVNVTSYVENVDGTATALTQDGRAFSADVVVAADGIGSKSCSITLGRTLRAVSTGFCADRVWYSTEYIKDAPALLGAINKLARPQLRVYTADNLYVMFLLSKTHIFLGITHKDDGTAVESWSSTIEPEQVAQAFPDRNNWDPILMEAILNTPSKTAVRWKLCCRNPQNRWYSDRGTIIQIGDAAHSFIPSSGTGAAMALEDAMSLAECLRLAGRNRIPLATKVHSRLRYERTTLLQHTGFLNRRQLQRDMTEIVKDRTMPLLVGKWVWTHDAEKYARENFKKAELSITAGEAFENTNLPIGHKVRNWTIEEETEKQNLAEYVDDLKSSGDWGIV
ncbi:uncharacterized protein FPRO_16040 [Fusarium proliferatum ET1]|uniref:Related to fusarubin cluster-monooxygenase n=1 Tax=Fusarium proliferatum (strain ET1) TaxID=1227346 RepID=A0A1L7WB61_FUSPR|nr:uncharacterized protein FPRO_16040 [Fusarium proliferatum ET1]CZR49832.1 related to fusarubin cluster-monooxygenase [Fusarium proliferatum ET1]